MRRWAWRSTMGDTYSIAGALGGTTRGMVEAVLVPGVSTTPGAVDPSKSVVEISQNPRYDTGAADVLTGQIKVHSLLAAFLATNSPAPPFPGGVKMRLDVKLPTIGGGASMYDLSDFPSTPLEPRVQIRTRWRLTEAQELVD